MATPARPAVVLVTTGSSHREDDDGWRAAVAGASAAAAAGIDVVQVREPDLPDRALFALVRNVIRETAGSTTGIVVNNRPDIAMAAGASGVHLRADGLSAARVRTLVPAGFLIGRSIHSLIEAREAAVEGAVDYLFFGTVFPSAGKTPGHHVQGTAALAEVCQSIDVPVIGIGGVTRDNVRELAKAGAGGLAAIGLFRDAVQADPGKLGDVVRDLRAAFAKASVRQHDTP